MTFCCQRNTHFILVQITFHLTNVILNISESHDGRFILSLLKQSNTSIFGAKSERKGNVCKAVLPNELKGTPTTF